MNKFYILFSLIFISTSAFSQGQQEDCYSYYNDYFQARGAFKVKDSIYEKVIISIRTVDQDGSPITNCLYGKVKVKNGAVVSMHLQFVDGEYEIFEPKFKNDYDMVIVGGVSRTQVTMDDEKINVFFVNHIRPKKKNYQAAPLIKFD